MIELIIFAVFSVIVIVGLLYDKRKSELHNKEVMNMFIEGVKARDLAELRADPNVENEEKIPDLFSMDGMDDPMWETYLKKQLNKTPNNDIIEQNEII